MNYEELSLRGFINEVKEVTNGPHPRKFCFVLGAGASRTSGIKSGQDLVRTWDRELCERNRADYEQWKKDLGINNSNMSSFYSKYYEKRFHRCPSDGYNYIEKIMESAKPSVGYVMLSHILTNTPHNVVVTTNFDHLTEDAVNYYAQATPLVIGHESLAHYVSAHPQRPTIVKIHRDLLFDPKSTTKDVEVLPENWETPLSLIFSNYHPVFIGYAGNDKSLMDFLVANADKFANREWKFPYWMLYENDKIEGAVQEFLNRSQGYYIKHKGFDEVLIELGTAFEYKIQKERDFLVDAKKRYKTLSNAITAAVSAATSDEETLTEDLYKKAKIENYDESELADKISDAVVRRIEASETVQADEEDLLVMPEELIELVARKPYVEESESNGAAPDSCASTDDRLSSVEWAAIEKLAEQTESLRQYRDATMLIASEKNEEAEKILVSLVEEEPQNPYFRRSYGESLFKQDKFYEAIEQIEKAIELNPNDEYNYYTLGGVYEQLKQYDNAEKAFAKSVEKDPEDAINRAKYAEVLAIQSKFDDAINEINEAIQLEPEDEFFHYQYGDILEKMGLFEEALAQYKLAIELDPKDSSNHYFAARMLEKLGRYEEAVNEYKVAIDCDPKDSFAYSALGRVYIRLKQYNDALEQFNVAISLSPDKSWYHESAGVALEKLERYDESLAEFTKSVELNSSNSLSHWRRAEILKRFERYDEALAAVEEAIELDAKDQYIITKNDILDKTGDKNVIPVRKRRSSQSDENGSEEV